MNESLAWVYMLIRWFLAGMLLLVALMSLFLTWRFRGIFHWKNDIRKEMENLKGLSRNRDEAYRQAVDVVYRRCYNIYHATSVDLSRNGDVVAFLRSIATCFHPNAERPELLIGIGNIVRVIETIARRLQEILSRPAFRYLRRVRVIHLRHAFERYRALGDHPVVRFSIRHRLWLQRLNHLRLIVFADPLSWLIRLLNQWIILRLTRFFLLDITLFIGRQAIEAYCADRNLSDLSPSVQDIEHVLEEIRQDEAHEDPLADESTRSIRSRLLAGRFWLRSPTWEQWKTAVRELVALKARSYFPDSVCPAEEALFVVLLQEVQALLELVAKSRRFVVLKHLHGIRASSLLKLASVFDSPASRLSGTLLSRSWDTYQWASIPLMLFRTIQRSSPTGIAWQTAWFILQRGFWYYIGKAAFDAMALRIDRVYRLSAQQHDGVRQSRKLNGARQGRVNVV